MKKQVTVDGNEAAAMAAYMFTEVSGIYPITPSSPMAEHMDEWSNQNRVNLFGDKVKVIEMQSEAGAAGLIHGSLKAGCLTTTFTASQGLLLMIPNMYKIAGELLPGVIHVAARSLATHALSIFGDHQDIYASRATGFAYLASSSVQDCFYMASIAHLSAIKGSVPFLHFFDGFRTSHEIQKINVLEDSDLRDLLDTKSLNDFRNKAMNSKNVMISGTAENDDIYFQATEVRNTYYNKIPDIVNDYMQKINKKAGTDYHPFEYYGSLNPDKIIIAMGSVCETIRETIDNLVRNKYKVGLIEVHLYRPFSKKYLLDVLPESVKSIAVLDRTKEPGSEGEPLYLDIVSALKDKNINIVGGRYGLSSKDTNPSSIKAIFDMLDNPINNFTVGIVDDVTNLSLQIDSDYKISTSDEALIYGYGSDGMVSASKSIMKLVGNNTTLYVQGYFQYDSKKSGGVTIGHLRFSKDRIRSTYYVNEPKLIVVTKESYLEEFDCYSNLKDNGIFILNTIKSDEELKNTMPSKIVKYMVEHNINFYAINAYSLARKVGLDNKISTVLESSIMSLINLVDYDIAKEKMKEYAYNRYFKKGEQVINANYLAIDESVNYLRKIDLSYDNGVNVKDEVDTKDIFNMLKKRQGDKLPVSAFSKIPDGRFYPNTSELEKRCISDIVPAWINSNCIQCNQCSLVCPHGVIRPYLLSKDEYEEAPDYVKNICKPAIGLKDYYFAIGISVSDCTGCGLCIKTCPGKNKEKALISKELELDIRNNSQKVFDYLSSHISDKKLLNKSSIKGSQFSTPKFAFSGACAGCGETAYIKLLTQLYGDSLMIANATGCSSIYGGSMPSMPYNIPWSNSLFEDNAEFGFGIVQADNFMRNRIKRIMLENLDNPNCDLFEKWLANMNDVDICNEVYNNIDYSTCPKELKDLKEYIKKRSIWAIGGDGWAYDIGFSGIDHVLSNNENINILVLDTQVYSNTGGQSSKASEKGSIAAFTSSGKKTNKKDLANIALVYPNCYVAQVSLAANPMQLIKVFKEANEYDGPSIIIAYAPCISHGIKGGMCNSLEMEKLAVTSGYYPLFHYNPLENKFYLDSKNVDFDKYEEFLNSQTRYAMLKKINPEHADNLLKETKENAIKRFEHYKKLSEN